MPISSSTVLPPPRNTLVSSASSATQSSNPIVECRSDPKGTSSKLQRREKEVSAIPIGVPSPKESIRVTPQMSESNRRSVPPVSVSRDVYPPDFIPSINRADVIIQPSILHPSSSGGVTENELRVRHTYALYKFTERRSNVRNARNVVTHVCSLGSRLQTILSRNTPIRYTTLFSAGLISYEEMKNLLSLSPFRHIDIPDYRRDLDREITHEQLKRIVDGEEDVLRHDKGCETMPPPSSSA